MSTQSSGSARAAGSTARRHGRPGGGGNPSDWDEGRNALIQFLNDLGKLLGHLVYRIPVESQPLFLKALNQATAQITAATNQLQQAATENHPLAVKLAEVGLTGDSGKLKLREFYEAVKHGPVKAILKYANIILGSLAEAIPPLELVKEFKETVETRLEQGGDAGIIALNLGGNEQWWNK